MRDKSQIKLLGKDVIRWNKWRKRHPEAQLNLHEAFLVNGELSNADLGRADLASATLTNANLENANLCYANLTGANLTGACLRKTKFLNANLHGANFSGADLGESYLYGADLQWANLSGANLTRTDLRRVNLSNADIRGADLREAITHTTNFDGVDLSEVKGLDTIQHQAPSPISISTIYRSRGKISFTFLRGIGVPDNFIEYMHSLTGTAFEFYSCFISYSFKDQLFAERIYADLQANGVRCWFATHHSRAGQKLHEQIDQAIRLHEKLLLILSADSMKSEWVKIEIKSAARRQRQEKKDILFPVSLVPLDELREWECWDNDLEQDLGTEIREYLIPDFRQWRDPDSYKEALIKLLKDLRSGKTRAEWLP